MRVRLRLKGAYHGKRGGSRDHDLGWVISRLATIYVSAGGKITASSQIRPGAGYDEPLWIANSSFIQFCRVFIGFLPHAETASLVDVGQLIHRCVGILQVESIA
jgi:hypothetical protein